MKYIVYISAVLGTVLLYLLSNASANTAASGEYYTLLVTLNIALAVLLVVLIGAQLFSLYRNIRDRVMGSRFTLRLLGSFALMAIIPGLIVYMVSVNFLTRSMPRACTAPPPRTARRAHRQGCAGRSWR